MEALLKRYYTKVQYFVGTVMNVADLHRVQVGNRQRRTHLFYSPQVDKATACLIIADKECPDPDGDDSANIMRVISLKNFHQRIRVLLQLLHYKNKVTLREKKTKRGICLSDECRFYTWLEFEGWR
jgi:potassium large conductance calcium-activated channel subfamily M alpha member 1